MAKIRQFGIENAIQQLTEASLPDDEYLGWGLTAVTAALIGAKGAYRCPRNDGGYFYFVYTDVAVADLPNARVGEEEGRQIECSQHGLGCVIYVCEHILSNPKQEWFSDTASPTNPWPDAWCAVCNQLYEQQGEWNDANPGICISRSSAVTVMSRGKSYRYGISSVKIAETARCFPTECPVRRSFLAIRKSALLFAALFGMGRVGNLRPTGNRPARSPDRARMSKDLNATGSNE